MLDFVLWQVLQALVERFPKSFLPWIIEEKQAHAVGRIGKADLSVGISKSRTASGAGRTKGRVADAELQIRARPNLAQRKGNVAAKHLVIHPAGGRYGRAGQRR